MASLSSERAKSNLASCMKRGALPLKENKVPVLPHRSRSDEIQLLPECVELTLSLFVQNQPAERLVISKVTAHKVETGAEEPALVPLACFQCAVGSDT